MVVKIPTKTVSYLSVKELIKILLNVENLNWQIEIRDKQGNKIRDASIVAVETLGCLFG